MSTCTAKVAKRHLRSWRDGNPSKKNKGIGIVFVGAGSRNGKRSILGGVSESYMAVNVSL